MRKEEGFSHFLEEERARYIALEAHPKGTMASCFTYFVYDLFPCIVRQRIGWMERQAYSRGGKNGYTLYIFP